MHILPLRPRLQQSRLRRFMLHFLAVAGVALVAASCGTTTATTQTERVVPAPSQIQPPQASVTEVTVVPRDEPTALPESTDADPSTADDGESGQDADAVATATAEPESSGIRSFQEFLPDAASIEEQYGDSGLWTLTDIRYLEPGPRVGLPCGDTEPPDFDGIEAVYTNISGENLLVMVQQGEGVDIWVQGVAEGVECTELGIRQSTLTVPGADQSVVLEVDPAAPAASMAVSGALQDDIFISFVAGAVSTDSPVADPARLVDLTVAMFDRINAAQ